MKKFVYVLILLPLFNLLGQERNNYIKDSAEKTAVEIGQFKDISSNEENPELSNSFENSLHFALNMFPQLKVSRTEDSASRKGQFLKRHSTNINVYGEFAIVDQNIKIYLRMRFPDGERDYALKVISNNSVNTMLAIQQAAQRIVEEVKKHNSSTTTNAKVMVLLPTLLGDEVPKYLRVYAKDLIINVNEKLLSSKHLKIISWQKAEPYYFSTTKGKDLLQQISADALVLFSFEMQPSEIVLVPKLYIKDHPKTIELPSFQLNGDEHIMLSRAVNNLFKEIINEKGTWNIEPLLFSSNDSNEYWSKGHQYYKQNNPLLSNYMYYKALNLAPNNATSHLNIGVNYYDLALLSQKNNESELMPVYLRQAKAQYKKSIELDPTKPKARVLLGNIYIIETKYKEAIEQFKLAYDLDPDYLYLKSYLGHAYYWNGNYKNAITHLESIGKSDENYIEGRYILGLSYEALKKPAISNRYFLEAYKLEPSNKDYKYSVGFSYAQLGIEKYGEKAYAAALKHFEIAYEFYNFRHIYNYMRIAYVKVGKPNEAERIIEEGVKKGVFYKENIYYNHASVLTNTWFEMEFTDEKLYRSALSNLKKHMKEPNKPDSKSFALLGVLYFNHNDFNKGIKNMEIGWNMDKKDFWAGVNLLEIYVVRSQYEKALELYDFLVSNKSKILQSDQKIMMHFFALSAKVALKRSYKRELKYLDTFFKSKSEIDGWYYNLYDAWLSTAELDEGSKLMLTKLLHQLKEKTS